MKPRYVLLFLAAFLGLMIGETALHFYFRHFPSYDIEMWRYALELKIGVDDARSHVHRPNSSSVLMGVPVQINSKGLRDHEYAYEKPAGTYRILVLGDSFALGWGVAFEKTFPKRLEAMLRSRNDQTRKYAAVEVVNAGIGNYNTAQELAWLRQEGLKYRPDEILLAYYLNDPEKTQKEADDYSLFRRSIIRALFLSAGNKISAVFNGRKRYNFYYRSLYSGKRWEEHQETLMDLERTANDRGIRLTILILPDFHDCQDYPFLDIHRKLAGFFQDRGHPVLDALKAFNGKQAGQFWVASDDPHPGAQANQIIADFIFKGIQDRF